MPVTQRWVHGGLILAVVVFSMCLTVLVLGATRPAKTDTGLSGSQAPGFSLLDSAGQPVKYNVRKDDQSIHVLIFTPHECPQLASKIEIVQNLVNTYRDDPQVRVLGIASIFDPSLLGPRQTALSDLEIRSPLLHTARDPDGTVARAYRVGNNPMLFVIDHRGLIRARLDLFHPDTALAATVLVNSLRESEVPWQSIMSDASARLR